jgi:hypothetical protein
MSICNNKKQAYYPSVHEPHFFFFDVFYFDDLATAD